MKKILAIAICLTMLLSLFSVAAFADEYVATGTPSGWEAYGSQEIVYNDALADVIDFDGDLSDWGPAGENVAATDLNYYNLYMWQGSLMDAGDDLPEDFGITTYFAADSDYLYIAFNIMDDTYKPVETGDTEGTYDGFDSFQISLDFMHAFANCVDNDLGGYTRAVWYSFAAREDGKMAITIDGQDPTAGGNMGDEPVVVWADNDDPAAAIKGACAETDGGWQAEFAISWDRLYYDAMAKLAFWEDSYEIDMSDDIELGALVAYLNHDNAEDVEDTLIFAAGTSKYWEIGTWSDYDGFRPQNHGIELYMAEGGSIDVDDSYTPPQIDDDDDLDDDEEVTTGSSASGPVTGGDNDDEDDGEDDEFPTQGTVTTDNEENVTTEAGDSDDTDDTQNEDNGDEGEDDERQTRPVSSSSADEEETSTEEETTTKAQGNDDEDDGEDNKDDDADKDEDKDDDKNDDKDDDKDDKPAASGGCGSVIGAGSVALVAVLGLGISLKKKD